MSETPRPRPAGSLSPHRAACAARSITAVARGDFPSSPRRYATGACFAAAARSSLKLSTTHVSWVTPTPRQKPLLNAGSSWRTYSTRIAGILLANWSRGDGFDGGDRVADGSAHRHHARSPRTAVQM